MDRGPFSFNQIKNKRNQPRNKIYKQARTTPCVPAHLPCAGSQTSVRHRASLRRFPDLRMAASRRQVCDAWPAGLKRRPLPRASLVRPSALLRHSVGYARGWKTRWRLSLRRLRTGMEDAMEIEQSATAVDLQIS
jgi:hypothetical protein